MAERRGRLSAKARTGGVAAAIVLCALAAIYVTTSGGGNVADARTCEAAAPRAKALDPFAAGEVAAFQVAKAPDDLSALAFSGVDGQPMSLAAFEGKVALVNIWATWCAPCRREMPALDALQAALGGVDFAVVPISIDTGDAARPRAFLDGIGVKNLPLYTDRSTDIFKFLQTRSLARGLPVTLLLDRDGCRLGHINGPAAWDSADARRLIVAAISPHKRE